MLFKLYRVVVDDDLSRPGQSLHRFLERHPDWIDTNVRLPYLQSYCVYIRSHVCADAVTWILHARCVDQLYAQVMKSTLKMDVFNSVVEEYKNRTAGLFKEFPKTRELMSQFDCANLPHKMTAQTEMGFTAEAWIASGYFLHLTGCLASIHGYSGK